MGVGAGDAEVGLRRPSFSFSTALLALRRSAFGVGLLRTAEEPCADAEAAAAGAVTVWPTIKLLWLPPLPANTASSAMLLCCAAEAEVAA